MSRTENRRFAKNLTPGNSGQRPMSKAEYVRISLDSCRSQGCCQDSTLLDMAYERYINNPQAPWNKTRSRRRA